MTRMALAHQFSIRAQRAYRRSLPLSALAEQLSRRRGVLSLCYHTLAPELDAYLWRTQAAAFDEHLRFLIEVFQIVPSIDAVEALTSGRIARFKRPLAVICFDDGYRDNWTLATPILERHSVPATLFAARDLVLRSGTTHLNPKELVELASHPLWQVEAHGTTHNALPAFQFADQAAEMRDCADWLADLTGRQPKGFAYPLGQAALETVACAREIFDHAFVTDNRIGSRFDPFQIRRYCPVQTDDRAQALACSLLEVPFEDGSG